MRLPRMPARSANLSSLGIRMQFVQKMSALSGFRPIHANSERDDGNKRQPRKEMRPENQPESFEYRTYEKRRMIATICPTTSASW